MGLLEAVAEELTVMLDVGVTVSLDDSGDGAFVLSLYIDQAACADCLVPDEVLAGIAKDALQRGGAPATSVAVIRAT